MEYEMKSILRSKASLVCLWIFLIVNMFSMNFLNLENDVERNIIYNEQLIVESQNSISQIDIIKKQLGEKIKPEQVEVLNNYKEYLNWKSKNANEAIDCLKKEGVKGFENYPDIKKYDLWNQMFEMDCFAKTDKQFVSNYDGNIYLEHVSFGYTESKMIIDDLSFKFEKGKKYAIVGPSGSGKSTILKLILGYYPVQKGNVSVLDSKNASMIHQESHIFDDTIRNNLNMELVQTDETLLKCMEFVDLPEFKLDQNICEDGSNLSGGQVQRIGIARTIAHLKEVLLCDEMTASLDAQTAIEIENRILDLKEETVLYVTHKYFDETLKKFDCILVFKQGRIVEQGSFEELMKNKEYFYSLKNKGRI